LMTCGSSSYETTSMLVERGFHWRTYRIKNIVISSQFGCIMTGTRESMSRGVEL
jgi:hypothetical protein